MHPAVALARKPASSMCASYPRHEWHASSSYTASVRSVLHPNWAQRHSRPLPPQEVQQSYEERYVESLGARPTKAAMALVSKLSPIAADGIELRLRKMGYQTDEVYVTPAPPQICERLLGGRRPAAARTMVRIAAANALAEATVAAESPAHSPETAGSPSRSPSPQRGAAEESLGEPTQNVFEDAVARFVFPFCLAPTLDRETQQRLVDVRMPPRLGDVPPVACGISADSQSNTPSRCDTWASGCIVPPREAPGTAHLIVTWCPGTRCAVP